MAVLVELALYPTYGSSGVKRIYRYGNLPIDKKAADDILMDNHRNNPPVNMHGRAVIELHIN
jgi:hypothetical protein